MTMLQQELLLELKRLEPELYSGAVPSIPQLLLHIVFRPALTIKTASQTLDLSFRFPWLQPNREHHVHLLRGLLWLSMRQCARYLAQNRLVSEQRCATACFGKMQAGTGGRPGEGRMGENVCQEGGSQTLGVLGGRRRRRCKIAGLWGWLWAAQESKMVPRALISRGWRGYFRRQAHVPALAHRWHGFQEVRRGADTRVRPPGDAAPRTL